MRSVVQVHVGPPPIRPGQNRVGSDALPELSRTLSSSDAVADRSDEVWLYEDGLGLGDS